MIQSLRPLRQHVKDKVTLLWDRLPPHRSTATQQHLPAQRDRLKVEWFPPYALELDPVEHLWAYLHAAQLANFAPDDLHTLAHQITRATQRICHRPDVAIAFLKQSHLFTDADFTLTGKDQ